MATRRVLSKAKKITLNVWTGDDSTLTPPAAASTALDLDAIVADSTTFTQEDPTTETIDCETSDSPIVEVVTAGKFTIEMTSADVSDDILEKALGYEKVGTDAIAAPASYVKKYATVEVEFQDGKFVLPKVQLTSKIDGSSLKTNVVKGTISGTCYDTFVKVGTNEVKTAFLFVKNAETALGAGYTISETATE